MAYQAPYVDETGLHISTFADTLAYLQQAFQSIYGSDVVLDNSTQDGQLCAVFAQAIYDNAIALQGVYNQFSPVTSIGAGLSSVVQINGISRQVATYSTVDLLITGVPNTAITNGIAQDTVFNNRWSLPPSVVIGSTGSITVTATCQTIGAVLAAANTITKILTPQIGWVAVNNPLQASVGLPPETDASLRARQKVSTALPSQSITQGLLGDLLGLPNVSQVSIYENQTATVNTATTPNRTANSIAVIVSGGDSTQIATTIYNRKTIGTNSAGFVATTGITVPITNPGVSTVPITFYRPVPVEIVVTVNVRELANWVSSTETLIAQAIVDYITSTLNIGSDVFNTRVIQAGYNTPLSNTYDITGVTLSASGKTPDVSGNILINDNEEAFSVLTDITVNSVPFLI